MSTAEPAAPEPAHAEPGRPDPPARSGWHRGLLAAARGLPLAVKLPAAAAAMIFAVALVTTQIALTLAEQREDRVYRQTAGIVLDGVRGAVKPYLSAGPQAVAEALSRKLTYQDGVRVAALQAVWRDPAGIPQTATASDPGASAGLRTHAQAAFTATAPGRPGWTVAGDYALAVQPAAGPGSAAVRAVFDLTALNADRRADRLWIAAVDVALAAVGALLAFVLVRRSLAPVGELTRRLLAARPDAGMPAWTVPQPATTEIGKLQRVLDRHVAAECERQSVLLELGKRDRAEGLAAIAAGLAHEVRNPLAGLLNGVSTLRRFGDDPQVRAETLDLIERGLRSLERVAAATLSTYRPPDDGRGFTEQDLADLTLLVAPEARRRQVALTRDGTLARTLAADANALRQVLMNLLLNAVKASPTAGTVRLKLRDAPGATAFQVVDSGPGLPDEVRAFLRGEQGGRLPQGQGLGLWTVLRLVDALGGRLSAVSLPGGGTTVTVTVVDSGGRSAGAPAAGDDRGAAERSR